MTTKRATQHGAQSQTSVKKLAQPKRTKQKILQNKIEEEPVTTEAKSTSPKSVFPQESHKHIEQKNKTVPESKRIKISSTSKKSSPEVWTDDSISEETDDDDDDSDRVQKKVFDFQPIKLSSTSVTPSVIKYNYNSMTKYMQVFKGSSDDHFETWEDNTRLYLEKQCPHSSEDQKMTAVKLKIQGFPRMILRQHPNIKTLDGIFNALRPTYGVDEITMLNEIKKMNDESVRVYFSRMKTNLHLLGYVDSAKGNRIFLNQFLNGLLPSLRTAVKALKPQNYSML